VDLQGHGRTADIDRPIDMRFMADDIAALIVHLGLGTADVLGYSLGGGVALHLAANHAQLVDRLVLVSAFLRRDWIYADVLAKLALPPSACVFIDDLPENAEGARAAGMHGITYTGPGALRAELRRLGVEA
jgi:pimeloyl-ACP methyl ester carboxylesterase